MSIKDLIQVVEKLRGPNGCPWDKAQTAETLTRYILEEAFELVEAIDLKDPVKIKEELGDYLFQVVLQSQIFSEQGNFNFQDVAGDSARKMTRRHPHVFGDSKLQTPEQVVESWQELKKKENPKRTILDEKFNMPALLAALKIGERSIKWKFDWDTKEQVFAKVEEEIKEIFEVLDDPVKLEDEFGDFLFAASQWARHLKIDPEAALRKANLKFQTRFKKMIEDSGLTQDQFAALPLDEKEDLWQKTKRLLKSKS